MTIEIVYQQVEWMKAADVSILQLLGGSQSLALTPSNVAHNVGLSREYTSTRLHTLHDHTLVELDKSEGQHPYFSISEKGRQFLHGELTVEELEGD